VPSEPFVWDLFEYFPCRTACQLRPEIRDDDKVVLRIGRIVDLGGRNSIAATIWSKRKGRVHVILREKGERCHDWPDLAITHIVRKICAICGGKTFRFLGSPRRDRMPH
jgi:hypothetical protein